MLPLVLNSSFSLLCFLNRAWRHSTSGRAMVCVWSLVHCNTRHDHRGDGPPARRRPARLPVAHVTRMMTPSHQHLSLHLQWDVFHGDTLYCRVSWSIPVLTCVFPNVSKYLAPPQRLRLDGNINKVLDAKLVSFVLYSSVTVTGIL